jgi:hypothetical protein
VTGRLLNVSPEVQQEIAALLAKGDSTGANQRLSQYRSNEERAYLIQKARSEAADRNPRKSGSRFLVLILLVVSAALVACLVLRTRTG